MRQGFLSTLMGSWLVLALVVSGCTSCVHRDRIAVHGVHIDLPKQQQVTAWPQRDAFKPWVIAALHATGHVRLISKPQGSSRMVHVQLQRVQQHDKPYVRVSIYIPHSEAEPKQYAVVQGKLQKRGQAKQESTTKCCWTHTTVSESRFRDNPKDVLHAAVMQATKHIQQLKHCKPQTVASLIKQLQQIVAGQQAQVGQKGRKADVQSVLHELGTCKVRQAATTIEQLLVLQHNARVSQAALQALGSIGSPDSVPIMIEFAHKQQDQKLMLPAIEAVGRIGGAQAAGWLFALSHGHNKAGIRKASAAALQQVSSGLPPP